MTGWNPCWRQMGTQTDLWKIEAQACYIFVMALIQFEHIPQDSCGEALPAWWCWRQHFKKWTSWEVDRLLSCRLGKWSTLSLLNEFGLAGVIVKWVKPICLESPAPGHFPFCSSVKLLFSQFPLTEAKHMKLPSLGLFAWASKQSNIHIQYSLYDFSE